MRPPQWTACIRKEQSKLTNRESDWNLPGVAATTTTRTRHGGNGRPSLTKRFYDEVWEDEKVVEVIELNETANDSTTASTTEEILDESIEIDASSSMGSVTSSVAATVKPPNSNMIIETRALTETIEENIRCSECGCNVTASYKTITIATSIQITCNNEECGYVYHGHSPAMARLDAANDDFEEDRFERITDFGINIQFVVAFLSSGDGGVEAARLLGLLGLPNDTTMEGRTFPKVEERISAKLQKLSRVILLENLTEEARLAFEANPVQDNNDFDQWKEALNKDENGMILGIAKYAKIDVSFDMGWQQRSSGNRYASLSGDALLVGCITRKPVAFIVKSKICNFCKAWNKKNLEDPPWHDCRANHGGSSSAMEPVACLEMVVDLFDTKHCIINRICCDDDASTSTRSLLRWSNADYMINNNNTVRPTVAKTKGAKAGELQPRPDRGRLPGRIPEEPKFVADPNHRKKVFTGDLWKIHSTKGVENRFTMTKMDINRLGTSFGHMVRGLHKRPKTEWIDAAKAVVDHHFDDHQYCGAWCRRKRMTELQRKQSERYYRSKIKDAKLYECIIKIASRFITMERLEELGHGFDTQINESFNNTASWFAPKNKVYCGSQSLENRLSMAIGINSIGLHRYFTRLYKVFGITMELLEEHLKTRDTGV
jgi:hypothetical protein